MKIRGLPARISILISSYFRKHRRKKQANKKNGETKPAKRKQKTANNTPAKKARRKKHGEQQTAKEYRRTPPGENNLSPCDNPSHPSSSCLFLHLQDSTRWTRVYDGGVDSLYTGAVVGSRRRRLRPRLLRIFGSLVCSCPYCSYIPLRRYM